MKVGEKLIGKISKQWCTGPMTALGNPYITHADVLVEVEILEHIPPPTNIDDFANDEDRTSFLAKRKE